jgi:hypothetical protein
MPNDYLHLLNCICLYNVNKQKDCWNEGNVMIVGATKLTADSWSNVVDDVYNQPTKKRPYYYIHNQNDIHINDTDNTLSDRNSELPSNEIIDVLHTLTSTDGTSNFNRTFDFDTNGDGVIGTTTGTPPTTNYDGERFSSVEKPAGTRYANASRVKVEIRCGRDKSNIFSLSAVQIDYVKAPQFIRLTQEQLDSDEDISQIMEFPDYVNQEIVNELVNLIMRKINDPSLSAHIQMTQSIARPTGQSQQQPAAQQG